MFSCNYINGSPAAQDDILDLDWFKLADLPQMIESGTISDEHVTMFEFMIAKYLKN